MLASYMIIMHDSSYSYNDKIRNICFTAAYDEVVHWKRNLFMVPFGRLAKGFVQELSRLFRSYG